MYKQAFDLPINKELLLEALKGGAIGSGLGGAALGGLTYLTDDSEDPSERNERLRNNTIMGMGLGGLTGAGVNYGQALSNTPEGPFDKSPIYKFLRGITGKSDVANGAAVGIGSQLKGIKNSIKDSSKINKWTDGGDKLNVDGRLGQVLPMEDNRGKITDVPKLKESLEGFIRGTKGKNPGGVGNIVDKLVSQEAPSVTNEGFQNIQRAQGMVKDLSHDGRFTNTGLDEIVNRLNVTEPSLQAGRASAPAGLDFDATLKADRQQVLGNMANRRAGGLLDNIWDGLRRKINPEHVGTGTYLDQIQGTASRKPMGMLGRGLTAGGVGYLGSKAVRNLAPYTTDPLMASPDYNKQMIEQYLKAQ